MNRHLPPLVQEIKEGAVTWQRLGALNYEMLGFFLSCHLVLEHYIDEFLKVCHSELDWEGARLTFGQKANLLTTMTIPEQFNFVPAIKHLNGLRNKLSHDIEFVITPEDLLPLSQFLAKAYENKQKVPSDPKDLLQEFMSITCAYFAGGLTSHAHSTKHTRK